MAGTSSGGGKFELPGVGGGSSGSSSGERWYFTQEALEKNSPTRKSGWDTMKELSYRQQTANFIQDMGQRLRVSQLCINTAIVYMHRFYVFHSFTKFVWYQLGTAALFLAAKVEEQPRKLEHVIRASTMCRGNKDSFDVNSENQIYDGNYSKEQVRRYFEQREWRVRLDKEQYQAQAQDLVFNENVLLQTLGFDVAIDHPHTHVVRCCHLVRADKDLAQSSYFLASNSLHLTTMCLQYKPTVVACFCIHLACKWSSWEIPLSNEGKSYTQYVDPNVDTELLNKLTEEFLAIFESCPSRLKEKIMTVGGDGGMHNPAGAIPNSPFDLDQRPPTEPKREHERKPGEASSSHRPPGHEFKPDDPHNRHRPSGSGMSSSQLSQREREYREKKEREKLAAQQHRQSGAGSSANSGNGGNAGGTSGNVRFPGQSSSSSSSSGHHPPPNYRPTDPNKMKQHSMSRGLPPPSHPSTSSSSSAPRLAEPRDILREAASAPRETPFGIAANQSVSGSREQHQQQQQKETPTAHPQKSQRDYLLKPNAAADAAAGYERPPMPLFNGDKTARPDAANHRSSSSSGRPYHHDPAKVSAAKHELARRHQEQQEAAKRQLQQQQMQPPSHVGSSSNNSYLKTPSTSQIKAKSPYTAASVPKVPQPSVPLNKHHHNNGSAPTTTSANTAIPSAAAPASGGSLPDLQSTTHHYQQPQQQQQQQQMPQAPQQPPPPPSVPKTRSLFSPPTRSPELIVQKKEKLSSPTKPVSPLLRTPPPAGRQRTRNYSSGSEPELRPVMKKIDQVEGFENLMRDSSIGINKLHQIPDIITPIADKIKEDATAKTDIEQLPFYKEMRPPDIIQPLGGGCFEQQPPPLVNAGLNNPAVISNLLKEVPAKSQLSLAGPSSASSEKEKERHHHKSKKKNKEKHKHKDKDKSREEKEKKKKHKEKDREKKHRQQQQQQVEQPQQVEPIPKLKIQGDKVQAVVVTSPPPPATSHEIKPLKIKISTKPSGENGATSVGASQQQPPATLKIKIPKEKLNSTDLLQQQQQQQSRKRDRHQERNSGEAPSAKMAKTSSSKQNGRYHKVTQLGDGDARLAESKYTNKSSSS